LAASSGLRSSADGWFWPENTFGRYQGSSDRGEVAILSYLGRKWLGDEGKNF